jgi:HEAT repeat protein
MGTNAVPFLIEDFQARDGLFRRNLPRSAYKFRLVGWMIQMLGKSAWERHDRAIYFLQALGSNATPAIPVLSDSLDRPDLAESAAAILAHSDSIGNVVLGPGATLPLLKAMTNGNSNVRGMAANALGLLGTNPDLVAPALIHALKDPSSQVRSMAARSFGRYKAEAATIIPALLPLLDDTDTYVRQGTAWMLGRFRTEASAATPKLVILLNDPDFQVRSSATNALLLIDPEALGRARPRITFPLVPPNSP